MSLRRDCHLGIRAVRSAPQCSQRAPAAAVELPAGRAAAVARCQHRGDVVVLGGASPRPGVVLDVHGYMLRAYMDHDANVVGALVLALGDRMRDATEEAAGMRGALPAALSALHEWAGGRTIETLSGGLRLSHSRTVRVVDRLVADGLAARTPDPTDGRGVLVHLTPAGHAAGRRVMAARAGALEASLLALGPGDRRALAGLAEHAPGRGHDQPPRRPRDLPPVRCARVRAPRGALPRHARGGRRGGELSLNPGSVGRRTAPSPSSSHIRCSRS